MADSASSRVASQMLHSTASTLKILFMDAIVSLRTSRAAMVCGGLDFLRNVEGRWGKVDGIPRVRFEPWEKRFADALLVAINERGHGGIPFVLVDITTTSESGEVSITGYELTLLPVSPVARMAGAGMRV